MRHIAERNWREYAGQETRPSTGYLLPYPIDVAYDGTVTAREGAEKFPDTTADVLGTKSGLYPDLLTT